MRIKNFIKKNYKIGIGVIIGLLISIVGVYASDTTSSLDVSYDNSTSNLKSNTLQGAIDELNEKATKPCRVIKGTGKEFGDEIACGTEEFYVLKPLGTTIKTITKYIIECGYDYSNRDQGGNPASLSNPSYLQTENVSMIGGNVNGASEKYRNNLIEKIGLSDSILVDRVSINDINNTICTYTITYHPSLNGVSSFEGSCPNLSKIGVDKDFWLREDYLVQYNEQSGLVPVAGLVLTTSGLSSCNNAYYNISERLEVTIPRNDIVGY